MDKNTITGFVLIGAVVIGFSLFGGPSQEEREAAYRQDSIRQVELARQQKQEAERKVLLAQRQDSLEKVAALDSTRLFFQHTTGEDKPIVLKNDKVEVTLHTLGGTIGGVKLLGDYKEQDKKSQVQLMTRNDMQLILKGSKGEEINLSEYYFEPVEQADNKVTMRLTNTANGGTLNLSYTLREGSYMTDITLQANGLSSVLSQSEKNLYIAWNDSCMQQEKGHSFESRYATLTYKVKEDDTENLSATEEETEQPEKALDWVAFKTQFFSCVLIGQQDFTEAQLKSTVFDEKSRVLKYYSAQMKTPFDPTGKQATQMQLYAGPNDFHVLKAHNELSSGKEELDLDELIDFGWPLIKWINRFFILYLFDWLTGWGLPMGIVLLLLTILIKVLVYPTTRKSYLSSARMRVLKPKVEELNKKYPKQEDALKKQQEQMSLYREYGVSPMGGCLPMLLQMPIWLALFNFVPNAIELRGQSFLWADDLSAYDDLIRWNTEIPLLGNHLSLFCVLFCVTNIVNTWISMRQQKDQMSSEQEQQMKMMRWMMYLMPLMFFFMFNTYSSGLCYYYFLSGLSSILIMWYLRKTTDDKKLLAQLEQYREQHKNDPKKAGGFAARLEALQKQQEALRQMQTQQKRK